MAATGPPTEEFTKIYDRNDWGYSSGVGSLPLNNIQYMELVRSFIARNQLSSVVDFGCGDWQFSRFIDWSGVHYTGVDLVEQVIEQNRARFARPGIEFRTVETVTQVPEADLLLCKDVFQHLSNRTVGECLTAFKLKFCYLLITNDEWPSELNRDIADGGWRPIRIDQPPFSEIAPVILSWTLTWGGWKPTRKSVSLVIGERRKQG